MVRCYLFVPAEELSDRVVVVRVPLGTRLARPLPPVLAERLLKQLGSAYFLRVDEGCGRSLPLVYGLSFFLVFELKQSLDKIYLLCSAVQSIS